jgi:nitrate/nitrite transporter NarK
MPCVSYQVAALPIGFTLDQIGPQRTSILGGVLFALGCFCFGLGIRTPGKIFTVTRLPGLLTSFNLPKFSTHT